MKRYNLKVLFFTTGDMLGEKNQSYNISLEAESMTTSETGCYMFYDGKGLKASYPIKNTIIVSIDNR